ncbi:hypothetical protein B0H13DRAFT_1904456 [Mycena leptocephala]|nr:hypothetical protein B0H13DRAFT_1904456 [Mycena leptocephala]
MSMASSKYTLTSSGEQQKADRLLQDLTRRGKTRNKTWYPWPKNIDFTAVSTPTCQRIRTLIATDTEVQPALGKFTISPETPEHEKIARKLDFTITQRAYYRAQRIVIAQEVDELLRKDPEWAYIFLKAARRPVLEFPSSHFDLLHSINNIRDALDRVEELVKGNTDLEATDPGSDASDDPDKTRVASTSSSYY